LYLNYGLLDLATILHEAGYQARMLQGNSDEPSATVMKAMTTRLMEGPAPVLLSVPSALALPWARGFCSAVRETLPEKLIVVGGRWVAQTDAEWLRVQLPDCNLVVFGTAEDRILQILDRQLWSSIPGTSQSTRIEPFDSTPRRVDYSLLDGYLRHWPSIEISRGCGRGCAFCVEAKVPLGKPKSPVDTAREMAFHEDTYQCNPMRFYFEASQFCPGAEWIREFVGAYVSTGLRSEWRCETRADCLPRRDLEALASVGLKVLDIGLESASPRQLLAMRKCRDPAQYLGRASDLLRGAHELGIQNKVNIMLYPGEDDDTVRETIDWLEEHRPFIKGLSTGSLIVYRGRNGGLLAHIKKYGGALVDETALDREGACPLHLSADYDHAKALEVARRLSKSFMDADAYYDLKSFCYFRRDLSRSEFHNIVQTIPSDAVSFRQPGEDFGLSV
jgi:hypothetical protein